MQIENGVLRCAASNVNNHHILYSVNVCNFVAEVHGNFRMEVWPTATFYSHWRAQLEQLQDFRNEQFFVVNSNLKLMWLKPIPHPSLHSIHTIDERWEKCSQFHFSSSNVFTFCLHFDFNNNSEITVQYVARLSHVLFSIFADYCIRIGNIQHIPTSTHTHICTVDIVAMWRNWYQFTSFCFFAVQFSWCKQSDKRDSERFEWRSLCGGMI